MSYEIEKVGGTGLVIKAHHRKLRPFYRMSDAMKRFIPNYDDDIGDDFEGDSSDESNCDLYSLSADSESDSSFSGFEGRNSIPLAFVPHVDGNESSLSSSVLSVEEELLDIQI